MPITKLEKFNCPICGFITTDKNRIELIRKNGGICPACQNGKGKKWASTSHKPIHTC